MNNFPIHSLAGFADRLEKGLSQGGITVSRDQVRLMTLHAQELILWNKKINLTAITDPLEMAEKHFIDSALAAAFLKDTPSLLDIGSGGGFPGIPVKILNPSIRVVLVDASRKKVNFLKHVIRKTGLKEIDAIHARVEDLHGTDPWQKGFAACISRAFADLDVFTGMAAPLLAPDGALYAMKGRKGPAEISDSVKDRFHVRTDHFVLPFERSDRYVIALTPKPALPNNH